MAEIFLRSHYLSLLAIVLIIPYSLFNQNLGNPDYIWVLSILPDSFYPLLIGGFLYVCTIVTTILNLVNSNIFLRTVTFVTFLMLLSFKYSFGKIDHVYHIWIVSSFCFIFYDCQHSLDGYRNKLIVKVVQSCLLMQYFSAGLWKLFSNNMLYTFDGITKTSLEHIAYGIAESDWPLNGIRSFLIYENPWIAGVGFIMVLLFQLLCGLCGISGRGYILCGVMAIAFHSTTGFALGIWYWGTAMAAAFFLIFAEGLIATSSQYERKA